MANMNFYSVQHSVLLNRNFKCEVKEVDGFRHLVGYSGLVNLIPFRGFEMANSLIEKAVEHQKSPVKRYFLQGLVITLRYC